MSDGAHHLTDSAGITHIAGVQGSTVALVCKPNIPYTLSPRFEYDDDDVPNCFWCLANRRFK